MLLSRHTWRRDFIAGLGGAAAAWPVCVSAQQREQMRRVGILTGFSENDPEVRQWAVALREALQTLGWTEGRNLRTEYYWGAADPDLTKTYTSKLIADAPDLIVTSNTGVAQALRQSPVLTVFVGIADPVGSGVVASLAKPGGNATGMTAYEPAITGKWLALLKEIAPQIQRAALIFNPATSFSGRFLRSFESDARSLSIEPNAMAVRTAVEIERAIEAFALQPNGGILMVPETTAVIHRDLIIRLAAETRLPAIYPYRYHAIQGGLAAYGIDAKDQWRRAAAYIDRILKGERPADLPVQAPTKFELVINLKTAKALGIAIPNSIQLLADEVIE
jgi:putative ABC transport system substrate-binding protein